MSRQPTWDLALGLQADMFRAVKEVGGLTVYFRGYGETRASKWVNDPEALARLMTSPVRAVHPNPQSPYACATRGRATKVNAVVYVGDYVEEDIDELSQRAGALGLLGVPMFLPGGA